MNVYIVTAYRYENREAYSYFVGVYSDKNIASYIGRKF